MEDIVNIDYYEDITSQVSSDESYYSVSSSPALLSYEEFDNYGYSSSSSSDYYGTYEPTIGQDYETFYPAPSYWIEVLGIFPTELGGTTYYNPLFYYVPVYSNIICLSSPDLVQEECENENTEYCFSDSDTEYSSLSSDSYFTAEESVSYSDRGEFNCEGEEFYYLSDTNLEKINFEYSENDEFELSEDKVYLSPESLKSNYEEKHCDDIDLKNEAVEKTSNYEYPPDYESNKDNDESGSENSSSICDKMVYKDILSQFNNSFEREESENLGDFNSSYSYSQDFSSDNSAMRCNNIGFGDNTLSKTSAFENSVKGSFVDNIKNDKLDKDRPFPIRGVSERHDSSKKCPMNAFEFGDVNNKDRRNQGFKKCNMYEDLSGTEPKQYLKKTDSLENLSLLDGKEIYEKDLQRENSEIGTDNYDSREKSLPFDLDDFVFTEEEIKLMKDQIYCRALSGKLNQKTSIPSVAVLPTIYEENEWFGEIGEEQEDSQSSCLAEQQGIFNGSLCNLFEISSENGEASEELQQKPKKKRMKRFREFLARMFCCVKPP